MMPYIHIILPTYMVMAFVGAVIVLFYVFMRIDKYEIRFSDFIYMFVFCIVGGFIGSKLLFIFTQLPKLVYNFSLDNMIRTIVESGIVFYGGLFGVIISLRLYTRKDCELRKRVFALVTPAIPLFHAFGRIGCFFAGCCYGKKLANTVIIMGMSIERFPVQLLESLLDIVIFIILVIIQKKSNNIELLRTYLIVYALVRFGDEFLRGDDIRGIYFGLSTAQWISVGIIMFYCVKGIWRRVESKNGHVY